MMELKKLPPSWKLVKLEALCEKDSGTKDPSLEPNKSFIYVDISSVDNVTKRIVNPHTLLGKDAPSRARKVIRTNDVIVSTTRPNLNAVALVPPDLDEQICSTGFCVLRANNDLESNYLFYFVQCARFVDSLTNLVSGALYPAVNDGQVLEQLIPLPPLLSEQRAIASRFKRQMEEIEGMRRAAERQLEAAKAVSSGIIRGLLEDFGIDDSDTRPLKELLVKKCQYGLSTASNRQGSGVPMLRMSNVINGQLDYSDLVYVELNENELNNYRLNQGDILINRTNSSELVGKSAMFDLDSEFVFASYLIRIVVDTNRYIPSYINTIINSPIGRDFIDKTKRQAIGQANINAQEIGEMPIPCPEIEIQQNIVETLSKVVNPNNLIMNAAEKQLQVIKALPNAYLREVFGVFEPPELDELPDLNDEAEELEDEDEEED